ncbi:hypothetical protein PAMP_001262 [Pampus punctatissimus]
MPDSCTFHSQAGISVTEITDRLTDSRRASKATTTEREKRKMFGVAFSALGGFLRRLSLGISLLSLLYFYPSLPFLCPSISSFLPSSTSLSPGESPVSEAEDQITQGVSEALWRGGIGGGGGGMEGGRREIRFHISSALLCLPRLPPPPPHPAAWRQSG